MLQTHSTSQQTMVTERERRYNGYYPTDAAAAVLVPNETHWYCCASNYCVHSTTQQMPAGSLAIVCSPILTTYFSEAGGQQKNDKIVSTINH